jgi:ribosomal protein L7/L12
MSYYKTELGAKFNSIEPNLRQVLDVLIISNAGKISAIKFLRSHLDLSLTEAKELYEARERFLVDTNEYGFIR